MTLSIDKNSYDYNFQKTLNYDVQLKNTDHTQFDIVIENGDYKNVAGLQSLNNACIIAILTRYGELTENPTYKNFGCHAHRIIKDNKTKINLFKLETYISQALNKIRRIKTVNSVKIIEDAKDSYQICFNVTSHNDETIKGKVNL